VRGPCHHGEVNTSNAPELLSQGWLERAPIRLGGSSCLFGAEVRYDGGHRHDRYLTDVVGKWFEWVPVCPEVELGLGVPRPPIRLVHGGDNPRLVEVESGEDLTERMESFAREKVDWLQHVGLDGFILKGASPSCGVEGVKVFENSETPVRNGIGVFARVLLQAWPDLPVAEDGWLEDPDRRRNFFENVLHRHWRRMQSKLGLDAQQSAELHAIHERLLAHISDDLR
jgi:uncharacterized protein YbbK (DUF523 family)